MVQINLDYTKDKELFNQTASSCAQSIGQDVENTQIRKFYDQVLSLEQRAKHLNEEEFEGELLPFVKMLNSKVAYAQSRSSSGKAIINDPFVDMMRQCINQVSSKRGLEIFKIFFEAVIGFHKALKVQSGGKR